MMKNNFLHIPYVCSSQGETLQISSGLIEAKNYVSPNTKTIGTGRTQEYKTSNRGIFFVVGSKQNLTTGSTDHRLSLKEIKFQKRHPSVIYLYTSFIHTVHRVLMKPIKNEDSPEKNEGMEPNQKQHPVLNVTGDRCCKEQCCIGTWNIRSMSQIGRGQAGDEKNEH